MVFYALVAPLTPLIILLVRRRVDHAHLAPTVAGAIAFLPASIATTLIHNRYTIYRIEVASNIMRMLVSDYLPQLFLLAAIIIILRAVVPSERAGASAEAIPLLSGGYFFAEALHRTLFLTLNYNLYELLLLPTLRVALIFIISDLFPLIEERKISIAGALVAGALAISLLIGMLYRYHFLLLSALLLSAYCVGVAILTAQKKEYA